MRFIELSITDFVARRFEKIIPEYLRMLIRLGRTNDIIDIGTYWYDNPRTMKNGEFDCAVKRDSGYTIIECKHLKDRMKESLASLEENRIRLIEGEWRWTR